jgi:uncharacterized protein (TIGR02147 family)
MNKTHEQTEAIAKLLRSALERLKKKNDLISIRSIAAHLHVSPSYLSKIFRGERAVSAKLLGVLIKALQLDHHEAAAIQNLLLAQIENQNLASVTGLKTLEPKEGPKLAQEYASLGMADFWLLDDWYHLPLLNLATTEDFESDPAWIAMRLGISPRQAERSLRRSLESGYLKQEKGKILRTELKLRFPTQRTHEKIRAIHHVLGKKGLEALQKPPSEKEFAERLNAGIAFAGDPDLLPQAKVVIEEALYKAAEILAGGRCTEVFQINLQLFKLTKDR